MNPMDLPISAEVSDQSLAHRATLFERLIGTKGIQYCAGTAGDDADCAVAATDRVSACVAWNPQQFEEAHNLVCKRYSWRGYSTDQLENDFGHGDDPFATTILAERDGITVGTLTLGFDSESGLLVEGSYPEEIRRARESGRTVCELTRLALAEGIDTKAVLGALFGLTYTVTRVLRGVNDIFIEVNPRHVAFYKRILGFVVAAGERMCDRVNAPSILLRLDIADLERRMPSLMIAVHQFPELLGMRQAA